MTLPAAAADRPPAVMRVDDVAADVRRYFREHGAALGLDTAALDVAYVTNPGGFVNASFVIADDRPRYHLKLATGSETRASLQRWHQLAPRLTRYHAPPVLEWIRIGDAAGILTPFLDGVAPALSRDVLAAVLPVLRALHADRELHDLITARPAPTAAACYDETYHDRFTADLGDIAQHRPAFIDELVLEWMHTEVARLAALVHESASFQSALEHPVHGDPWLENVLWQSPSAWHLLDWDELRVGDPAADIAMLTGPSVADPTPLKMFDDVASALSAAERERLRLLGRASLLDWIIDPVADWIAADSVPAVRDTARAEKQRVHCAALALYRTLY